jgi:hypothetical protein
VSELLVRLAGLKRFLQLLEEGAHF